MNTEKKQNKNMMLLETIFILVALCVYFCDNINTFALIFLSIILEALPFMLLGSLVSGLVEVFVSREKMLSFLPKNMLSTTCISALMGFIFPVCECGIVLVVRRLTRKGLPISAAIAYLLSAPIVNPIVIFSTAWAYQMNWKIVLLRMLFGYFIAVTIGLVMGSLFEEESPFIEEHSHACKGHCCHNHNQSHDIKKEPSFLQKISSASRYGAEDFITVAHYLIIGAFIAALCQTFINREVFVSISKVPFISICVMMLLAILLNLCSEADAFIAASFRNLVPLSAQMAFMLIGPMFDLKLLLMYQGFFKKKAIIILSALILVIVFMAAVELEIIFRVIS